MARTHLKHSWETSSTIEAAKPKLGDFLDQNKMNVVSQDYAEALNVTADQGSQLITRLLGGWFVNPIHFPKRARISLYPMDGGIRVEATIEETLGVSWFDRAFQNRYEGYFRTWMDALLSVFPPSKEP